MADLKLEDLSCCDSSDTYYPSILYNNQSEYVTSLEMEVDRGVDFQFLLESLNYFPNLKTLTLKQNYAHGKHVKFTDFIGFLENMSLEKFTLVDFQSEFLNGIHQFDLFGMLPNNCEYTIVYGDEPQNHTFQLNAMNNKSLIFNH
jgi:hypothetical protein